MKNTSFLTLIFLALALILVWSCKNENKQTTDENAVDSAAIKKEIKQTKAEKNTSYRLPSPVEFYMFIHDAKAKFKKNALNSPDNISKYMTTSSKSLNFGIYASDLAYCTVFGENQETFVYFSKAKQLADDLGLTEGFDAKIANRINTNINNSDSLYKITNDSYWDAVTFLEEQDKANLLPFILVGSWVESLHIAFSSVDKFSTKNEVVVRIAEQQLLLENLLDHLNSLGDNDQLKGIITKLTDLQSIFDQLYENGDNVIITEAQFKAISKKVEDIRKEFVS